MPVLQYREFEGIEIGVARVQGRARRAMCWRTSAKNLAITGGRSTHDAQVSLGLVARVPYLSEGISPHCRTPDTRFMTQHLGDRGVPTGTIGEWPGDRQES